ncbi:MAG: TonB-dependent receptor, partial [Nonlabens sp.]
AFAKAHNVYANIATSFETPALSELSANPTGDQGFNEDLEAQKAINYEIGIKGHLAKGLSYQTAIFYIDTEDDLVPFELAAFPDRTFFRNAGKTTRKGLEVEGAYAFTKAWSLTAAYTFSEFKYNDFVVDDVNFDGNLLPGIPKHLTNIGLQYQSEKGFFATVQASLVGKQYANDSNEATVDGYENINFRTSYSFIYKKIAIKPYAGLNNILDQEYTDNVRINAFGSRFFEPAPGINGYGGIEVRF